MLRLFLLTSLAATCALAQRAPQTRVPVETPPGWPQQRATAGLPWPESLGKRDVLTGHIAAIDGSQMLVRSPDHGEVLFWTDERTIVRVEKFRLAVADLRKGDPVAVKLKKIKDRGPVASEILPHPDVRQRKERGEPAEVAAAIDTPGVSTHGAGMHGAALSTRTAADDRPATPEPEAFPALPRGATGIVGTVTAASAETMEVRDRENRPHKVLLTTFTLHKRAGTGAAASASKVGDRVAVVGDRLDGGEWLARDIFVIAGTEEAPTAAAAAAVAAPAEVGPDGVARFTGVIAVARNDELIIRTTRGDRTVVVHNGTQLRRLGIRANLIQLKVGDEVSVIGDILEGGIVIGREVTVTRLTGS